MSDNTADAFDYAVDALIAKACGEIENQIFDEYEEKIKDNEIVFSDNHVKIMQQLFNNERNTLHISNRRKIRKHILIAAIILMAVLLALAVTVGAFREKIIDFTLDIANKNSEIEFEKEEEIFFEKTNMNINFVPAGFEEEKRYTAEGYVYAKYSDEDAYFTVEKEIVPDKMIIDTENAKIEEMEINGCKAVISSRDNLIIIVWSKGDHAFTVTGNIEKDKLKEIAKSVS